MKIKWNLIITGAFLIFVAAPSLAQGYSITPQGALLDAGRCKILIPPSGGFAILRRDWNGPCVDSLAHGQGVLRLYDNNSKLLSIALQERSGGLLTNTIESYSRRGADRVAKSSGKPGAMQVVEDFPPSQVPKWAREITQTAPSAPTQTAQAAPPSATHSKPQGSESGGGAIKEKGGARFGGSMATPTGVYFLSESYGSSFVESFLPRFGSSESAALATYGGIQSWKQKYEGAGCPAGSRVGGPYWATLRFSSARNGGRRGAAWVCGATSERAAAFAAIDICKNSSCADTDMYLYINVGSAVTGLYPQYVCAEGHYTPGARPGTGPRNGKGWRARERKDGSGNDEDHGNPQDTTLCNEIVERWH